MTVHGMLRFVNGEKTCGFLAFLFFFNNSLNLFHVYHSFKIYATEWSQNCHFFLKNLDFKCKFFKTV